MREGHLRAQKDAAYRERNQLVAALSKIFPASLERDPTVKQGENWGWVCFIDLPAGQATWHIHDEELPLFDHLPRRTGRVWDGHTNAEKYARLAELTPVRFWFGVDPAQPDSDRSVLQHGGES